jgi:hypothetical protein
MVSSLNISIIFDVAVLLFYINNKKKYRKYRFLAAWSIGYTMAFIMSVVFNITGHGDKRFIRDVIGLPLSLILTLKYT